MEESLYWGHPIFLIAAFVFGCCVGSYLNVVIYRLPLGLSTRDPKRSFCPTCKKQIPIYRNIPIVTWIIQGGKCADCNEPISVRYLLVELLTGLVWALCWWFFAEYQWQGKIPQEMWYPPALAGFFIVLATIAVVISFIDIEHLIIPIQLSVAGALVSLVGAVLLPWHLIDSVARAEPIEWWDGLEASLIGGAAGFFGLWAVVLLGKLLFGRTRVSLEEPASWHLREGDEESDDPNENLSLVIDGEDNFWHELFYRKSDKLLMNGVSDLEINGEKVGEDSLVLRQQSFHAGEKQWTLEEVKSMSGKVSSMVIPREAMGMGDVHLLGVIGLCLGIHSLLFVILAACLIGIVIHLSARAGLGKQMPFGPSLILGAVAWIVCGPEMVDWYMEFIRHSVFGAGEIPS